MDLILLEVVNLPLVTEADLLLDDFVFEWVFVLVSGDTLLFVGLDMPAGVLIGSGWGFGLVGAVE